ncbi:hypothetical protein [Spiroplasma endosymbiont of Lasioglossum villosulum]|uniref:hypothetical protein n=1 Tax=Spiroplasma endosymbiont of Lasioglossum villosulum TaxID=3066320 RepID=UPI0030CB9E0B
MTKDKNIINETIDYLPLFGARLGAGLGAIDGLSWTIQCLLPTLRLVLQPEE